MPTRGQDESEGVHERIRRLRNAKKLSQTDLAHRVGEDNPMWVSRREMDPSKKEAVRTQIDEARRIATALDVPLSAIIGGEDEPSRTVPVVGFVGAGDLYYPDPLSGPWVGFDLTEAPPGASDVEAVIVRGDSMAPVYRDRDTLFFSRKASGAPAECVGQDCIVQVRNGPTYLKTIEKGSRPGRYSLHSYSANQPPIENVEIEWAAPIEWCRRSKRR
jgi:transcriptional regulator with XRE-family HTH domain